jgi:hypothetical protein
VEYRVPYDIGIPEEICIQVEFRILWYTASIFFDMKRVKKKDRSEDSIVLQIQALVLVPEFYRTREVYRIPVFYGIALNSQKL